MNFFWIIPFFLLQAQAEQEGQFPAALASTQQNEPAAGSVTPALGIDQAELDELLWFFRREDPSTWNYSVLVLSFVAMTLGLLLLAINVARNRKRKKIHRNGAAAQALQQAEPGVTQALMAVPQEHGPAEAEKEPVPQDQKSGAVIVQWKDGTVTSLYTERPENAMQQQQESSPKERLGTSQSAAMEA